MTLGRLADQLSNVRGTYLVGLVALAMVHDEVALDRMRREGATFGQNRVRFAPVVAVLKSKDDGEAVRAEFGKAVLREVVVGVRAVVSCAVASGVELDLEGVGWWKAARLVAAILWSGGILREDQEETGLMPFAWNGIRFERSEIVGRMVTIQWFGYHAAFNLVEEATHHVEKLALAEHQAVASVLDFNRIVRGQG